MHKSLVIKIILSTFFIFSLFLHFYQLDSSPKAVLVDEAALGINAYSIAQTGKDEFGTAHPFLFKSFGDQKLPLYIYASAIPVKLFGLSIFSIRFVAAVSASLLVLVIFFLLRELDFDEMASLAGAGVTAVSSWIFLLGRFGWESSLALLIFTISLLSLAKALNKNNNFHLILGALFLGITWYTYIPYRVIALLSFFIFLLVIKTTLKKKIIFLFFFLVVIFPSLTSLVSPAGSARFKQTTIIYDQVNALIVNDRRLFCNEYAQQTLCSLIINKPIEIGYTALKTAARIISFGYLFVSGESDGQLINIGKFALLPFFMAPFYFLGFVQLYVKSKEIRKKRQIIFIGLSFLSCFAPILVTKSPVRVQMSSLFPFILIIVVFGYSLVSSKIKNNIWHYLIFIFLFIYGIVLLFYFINVHSRRNYGNEKFIAKTSVYLEQQYNNVNNIYVDPSFTDYITFYSFYNKVYPTFYQKNIQLGLPDSSGFQHTIALGKIKIFHSDLTRLACDARKNNENDLLLTNQDLSKNTGRNIQPLFDGKDPDQLIFGYIYKLSDIVTDKDCSNF